MSSYSRGDGSNNSGNFITWWRNNPNKPAVEEKLLLLAKTRGKNDEYVRSILNCTPLNAEEEKFKESLRSAAESHSGNEDDNFVFWWRNNPDKRAVEEEVLFLARTYGKNNRYVQTILNCTPLNAEEEKFKESLRSAIEGYNREEKFEELRSAATRSATKGCNCEKRFEESLKSAAEDCNWKEKFKESLESAAIRSATKDCNCEKRFEESLESAAIRSATKDCNCEEIFEELRSAARRAVTKGYNF